MDALLKNPIAFIGFFLLCGGGGFLLKTCLAYFALSHSKYYRRISQKEAKRIMDDEDIIVLDVRTPEEYAQGHIKHAILLPYDEIGAQRPKQLPNPDQKILIYCRSGRRSKIAAKSLSKIGYTNICEFGGILTWTYEITK